MKNEKLPKKEGYIRFVANYISNVFTDYNPVIDGLRISRIPIELSRVCLQIY